MQGEARDGNSFTEALCIVLLVLFGMAGAPRIQFDPHSGLEVTASFGSKPHVYKLNRDATP